MDITVEKMVATFAHHQLAQALTAGASLGLSPVTVATTMLQVAAGSLAGVAQAETVARAFEVAAYAVQTFPAPQGRA